MKTRIFLLVAGLVLCGAAVAAPPAASTRTAAPAAATCPCPMMQGNMPCPGAAGKAMPCRGMMQGRGPGDCPGMAPAAASKAQTSGAEPAYGWQLMTPEERAAYQARMRAAKTEKERAAIRAEHHKEMLQRAKEQGVTLPEEPPPA
ncbi:MAG TPA: hypothetical protein VHP13_05625 [Gammaproteobacteria bacterium]|jgi:hypothetical protein|nr:hypothetical protein [Gammaproteobacteria bacterium]